MEFNIETYLSDKKKLVDREFLSLIPESSDSLTALEESIRYSLLAGGKRLRPILCLAASEALEGSVKLTLPVACAIEMIHTYSLIHDDLPSMDDDELRRGLPTNHNVFGEPTAILAGDALLADAFFLIASKGSAGGISPSVLIDVIKDIADAAGSRGMVRGQSIDLFLEGKGEVTIELIEEMHSLKTGALIKASVTSGARVGGATEEQLTQLSSYGKSLGLAFQILDDVLDIEGGSKTGKSRGADARRKKATYPDLIGVEESKDRAIELTKEAVRSLESFDKRADPLRELARYLGVRKY